MNTLKASDIYGISSKLEELSCEHIKKCLLQIFTGSFLQRYSSWQVKISCNLLTKVKQKCCVQTIDLYQSCPCSVKYNIDIIDIIFCININMVSKEVNQQIICNICLTY